jgi:hypothetical protein
MVRAVRSWIPVVGLLALGAAACDQTAVTLPEATSLSASPESMSMVVGEESSVSAHVLDQQGNVLRGASAAWSSSEPSVASVTADGTVTARSAGSATLTASYGGQTANVNVSVSAEAAGIDMAMDELHLFENEQGQLSAQVLRADGTPVRNAQVTWTSHDPNVARVFGSGTTATVTARTPGTATVTAQYGNMTASTEVTVERDDPRVVDLEILTEDVEIDVREGTRQIFYRAFDERGRMHCTGETGVQVESSDEAVVTAGNSGGCSIWINGQIGGTATVTVTIDDASDSFEVTVHDEDYAFFVTDRPEQDEFFAGNTVAYTVRVVDQDDDGVEGQTVNFTVNRGRLVSTSATTDEDGYATIEWRLPTTLRQSNSIRDWDHGTIQYSVEMPDGEVRHRWHLDGQQIVAAEAATITFWQRDVETGDWFEVEGSTTAETFRGEFFAAEAHDEFGNRRDYRFIEFQHEVEEEGTVSWGTWEHFFNGRSYRARYLYTWEEQTVTLTAYDRDQTWGAIDEDAHFSASLEIIFEDADDE